LALGVIPGLGILLLVHLIVDCVFVTYVALLVRTRNVAAERDMKVRFLPSSSPVEPAFALRRSAR
jgi:hypothetical protein